MIAKKFLKGHERLELRGSVYNLLDSNYQWPDDCLAGDVDDQGDGPDIGDLVYLGSYMFQQGPPPPCMPQADINQDGSVADIRDLVYFVQYMFSGGPPLPDCHGCWD